MPIATEDTAGSVRTESWMGPPQGKRAPSVGPISIVILAREGTITDWTQCHGSHGFHTGARCAPCVRTGSWTGPPRGKRAPKVGSSDLAQVGGSLLLRRVHLGQGAQPLFGSSWANIEAINRLAFSLTLPHLAQVGGSLVLGRVHLGHGAQPLRERGQLHLPPAVPCQERERESVCERECVCCVCV